MENKILGKVAVLVGDNLHDKLPFTHKNNGEEIKQAAIACIHNLWLKFRISWIKMTTSTMVHLIHYEMLPNNSIGHWRTS